MAVEQSAPTRPQPAELRQHPGDVGVLLERHAGRVYAFVHRLVGSDAAEDVCQEVWIAVHRALPTFRGDAAVTTWLFAIAARTCRRWRSRRRLEALDEPVAEALPEPHRGPEQQALAAELGAVVRQAIDALPPGQRAVVHLRCLEGRSYADIARILDIPIGTVRSRLHHSMSRLAERLAPYVEDDHERA